MYEAAFTIALLYLIFALVRRSLLYYESHHLSKKERNQAPYHYNTPKQGTIKASECNKLVEKCNKKLD